MTPNRFAQLLQSQGFPARLSVAGGQIAQLLCEDQDIEWTITFLPAREDGSSVDEFTAFSFLFRSGIPSSEPLEAANVFNCGSRFVRYSVSDETMSIEMDVAIPSAELTAELAMRQVNIWIMSIARYRNVVAE